MEPMRNVLAAQFWNEEMASARSLDAVVHPVPSGPPALGLVSGSKLSRSQQLLLLQRVYRVPFMFALEPPNVQSEAEGGLVLDRVLGSVGNANWWITLTGRARPQQLLRICRQEREKESHVSGEGKKWLASGRCLMDSSLYALSSRARILLGQHTSLSGNTELDSLATLFSNTRSAPDKWNPWHSNLSMRHKLNRHKISLEAAWHEHFVDREAQYWNIPRVMSLDLSSLKTLSGFRYRFGVLNCAGVPVKCGKVIERVAGGIPCGPIPGCQIQAAISLEKHMEIWKDSYKFCRHSKPYNLLAARPHISLFGIVGSLASAVLDLTDKGRVLSDEISSSTSPSSSRMAWTSSLTRTDIFGSLGVVAQFGFFQRAHLDHTKLGARLDFGTASSFAAANFLSTSREDDANEIVNKNFPSFSVSLQQQVAGPLRARIDSRFFWDSTHMNNWPQLQEVTYGLDWSLQPLGASRIVAWFSPSRQEAMAELRAFET